MTHAPVCIAKLALCSALQLQLHQHMHQLVMHVRFNANPVLMRPAQQLHIAQSAGLLFPATTQDHSEVCGMLQVETLGKAVKVGSNAKKSKRNSSPKVRPDVCCSSFVGLCTIGCCNCVLCMCMAW